RPDTATNAFYKNPRIDGCISRKRPVGLCLPPLRRTGEFSSLPFAVRPAVSDFSSKLVDRMCAASRSHSSPGIALAHDRTLSWRQNRGHRGHSERARRFLHGAEPWRRLEDDRPRVEVKSKLR